VPSATADRARGHACLLACFTHFSSNMSALVTTRRPLRICPHPASAVAPNLERLHLAPHALGPLGAARTMHWTGRRGSGLMWRVLFERTARLAGVLRGEDVQPEHRSLEHCENDVDELCMRPLPSAACALAWHAALRGLFAVGRGRSRLRPCMLLVCFSHLSSITCAPVRAWSVCPTAAVAPRLDGRAPALGPRDTARTVHWTDHRGSGLMQFVLFESVWLGPQAFYEAKAFNANIGAWNTARIANMAYVCALCHRQRVRSVCFMLAFVLDSFLEHPYVHY
jgi:hypothetical protein